MTTTNQFQNVGQQIKPENWAYAGNYIYFRFPDGEDGYETESELDVDFELMGIGISDQIDWINNFYDLYDQGNNCSCCNHKINRGMFFVEKENVSNVIYVGFDCGKNILQYTFDVSGAKKQTMIERKRRLTQMKVTEVLDANAGLEDSLAANDTIIRDISAKFYKTGVLSDKQISFINSLAERRKQFESIATEFVEGKIKDKFKVLSCKGYTCMYSNSLKYKLLLENVNGRWKSYGNLATKLEVGSEITASGTFVKSDTDPLFGFFKRLRIVI